MPSKEPPLDKSDLTIQIHERIAALPAADWNRLAGPQPFLQHAFLVALEETGCVGSEAGWQPLHIGLWQGDRLAGAMPLYLKSHSWGEYVFDWAWADAYERNGLEYYPKLVSAIPFTPVQGPRLLTPDTATRKILLDAALALAGQLDVSSLHVLFPCVEELPMYQAAGLMLRQGVQFHWQNQGYASFDAFLAAFNHDKRKKVRQDRRKVTDAGITFNWRSGSAIRPQDWAFFNRCYRATYRAHHSTPYLNLAFFEALGEAMQDRILLIEAVRGGRPVAAALNLFDSGTLYGRYWGALEYWPNLHFETCYYQPIEYCIQQALQRFEAGAQGEHKLARGLLPVPTHSAHWLAQPQFARAVEEFLARETAGMQHYMHELNEHSPFQKKATEGHAPD